MAKPKSKRERPGGELEEAVARIQEMMDPGSSVTRNEWLTDRVGIKRECDVVIRGHFAGQAVLGVIECKDWSRKVGVQNVEAFSKKVENLGANVRAMVSRKGFTKDGLKLAEHEHIGCWSLLPDDPGQVGFSIGQMVYGIIRKWTKLRLHIHFSHTPAPIKRVHGETVKWQGKPVWKWFARELMTKHGDETREGDLTLQCEFEEPRSIEIEGKNYLVNGIDCEAIHVCLRKRTWVQWSGDAYFDWHTQKLHIPPKSTIVSSAIESDMSAWQDYEGEIPEPEKAPADGLPMRVTFFSCQKWDTHEDEDVPDLSSL